jgi:NAD(P)-dependent dehydrogenase (short-subunit alcohol dehydrogenase family)
VQVGIFFVKEFAEVDCVHVVLLFKHFAVLQTTDEEWQRFFDVNVMSAVRLCRRYLPRFQARNSGTQYRRGQKRASRCVTGRIILIASDAGMRTIPHLAAYSVSKSAMIGLGRVLAEGTKGQFAICLWLRM